MKLKFFLCAAFITSGSISIFGQTATPSTGEQATTPVPSGFPATPTPKPTPVPLTGDAVVQHFLPREIAADTSSVLALAYNGHRRSQIGPCGCVSKQLGGFDKEARLFEVLKEKGVPTVAVDAGGYLKDVFTDFDVQRTKGALKAMGLLGYDAVNVAYTDIGLGVKELKDVAKAANVPLVSANIVDSAGKPAFDPYRVETVKLRSGEEVKVGFVGVTRPRLTAGMAPRPAWTPTPKPAASQTSPSAAVLPEGTLRERDRAMGSDSGTASAAAEAFTAGDPVEALKKYIPELKEKCDVLVVLSYGRRNLVENQLKELGDVAQAIDIAVAGEYSAAQTAIQTVGQTRVVSGGFEGRQAGLMMLQVEGGEIKNQAHKWIEIEQSIPSVPEIQQIVEETKKATVGQVGGAASH